LVRRPSKGSRDDGRHSEPRTSFDFDFVGIPLGFALEGSEECPWEVPPGDESGEDVDFEFALDFARAHGSEGGPFLLVLNHQLGVAEAHRTIGVGGTHTSGVGRVFLFKIEFVVGVLVALMLLLMMMAKLFVTMVLLREERDGLEGLP